jgi:hypothetical protein
MCNHSRLCQLLLLLCESPSELRHKHFPQSATCFLPCLRRLHDPLADVGCRHTRWRVVWRFQPLHSCRNVVSPGTILTGPVRCSLSMAIGAHTLPFHFTVLTSVVGELTPSFLFSTIRTTPSVPSSSPSTSSQTFRPPCAGIQHDSTSLAAVSCPDCGVLTFLCQILRVPASALSASILVQSCPKYIPTPHSLSPLSPMINPGCNRSVTRTDRLLTAPPSATGILTVPSPRTTSP